MTTKNKAAPVPAATMTPGPWTVEDRDARLLIWADGRHDFIAQLDTSADGVDDPATADRVVEEQQANAHAIAATPEALDACREIKSVIEAMNAQRHPDLSSAYQKACRALNTAADQ